MSMPKEFQTYRLPCIALQFANNYFVYTAALLVTPCLQRHGSVGASRARQGRSWRVLHQRREPRLRATMPGASEHGCLQTNVCARHGFSRRAWPELQVRRRGH